MESVTTSRGDSIRLKLVDSDSDDGYCFIHLPKRIVEHVTPVLSKLVKLVKSKKGLYFQFKGMKGLAFKFRFKSKVSH